jgi:hypothetical protein
MPPQQSVTVESGGMTVTSNTANSEADLLKELEPPAAPQPGGTPAADGEDAPPSAARESSPPVRDEKGRFARAEAATPPAELPDVEASDAAEATPGSSEQKEHPRNHFQARVNKLTQQKAEAERRAQAAEAALALIQQRAAAPPPMPPPMQGPLPGEPQFEQFAQFPDPYTAYLQAWTRWDHARQVEERFSRYEQQQTQKSRMQTFEQRVADGRKAHPDFDQVLTDADTLGLQVSGVMQEAIVDSPHAADLVHYLATHPEECTQLAEESEHTPVAAAAVMRRLLESRISTASVAPSHGSGTTTRAATSTAKPPITPVGSSPVVSDQPPGESASLADHARYWNRRLKVPGALK